MSKINSYYTLDKDIDILSICKKLNNIEFYKSLKLQDNSFKLENLQFKEIDEIISEETINYHYSKHHATYLQNVNTQKYIIEELNKNISFMHEYALLSLIESNKNDKDKKYNSLYQNSMQCINHSFYWNSIEPNKNKDTKKTMDNIFNIFGGKDNFEFEFKKKVTHFGSAWVWLVMSSNKNIFFFSTSNAENPIQYNLYPLVVCDIWEHAYYIDYRNDRSKYMTKFLEIINWEFIQKNIEESNKFFI